MRKNPDTTYMNSFHKKYTVCSLVLLCIVSCAKNKDGQDTLYPRVPLALIEVDGSNYVAPPILMSEMEGKPYIEHDFPFFNSSNYDVTVDLTGVSCGCLEPIDNVRYFSHIWARQPLGWPTVE
jgi:hypothetical protein